MAKKSTPPTTEQPTTVIVKNIGNGLVLVGENYLLEGEKREVSRAIYEAAVAAGYGEKLEIVK